MKNFSHLAVSISLQFSFQVMMVKKMHESDSENEIREAYRVFDKERTGCIAVSEMRLILSNLPEKLSEVRGLGRPVLTICDCEFSCLRMCSIIF